jgi:patatin-like phospholipase/acyl hydrolase
MPELVKVLSIDGGGIRGIIPAAVLADLERRLDAPIAERFDLITGTSTGGIIALGLTAPGEDGKPANSAAALVELYKSQGHKIFSRSVWHEVRAVGNAMEEKYPASGVESVLQEYLGETRLKDALTEVFVTAYEIEDRIPWFFSSRDAATREGYDFAMWEVGRATSAAPTYFEPARLPAQNDRGYWAFVDGGMFANNPALCGLTEAVSNYREQHEGESPDILLVSLGTGELTRTIPYDKARYWGLVGWAHPLLGVIFDGVSKTVDFQVAELCRVTDAPPQRYYRMQVSLKGYGSDDLDDASGTNIAALERHARELIERESDNLDEIAEALGG